MATTLDYISVPHCATRLSSSHVSHGHPSSAGLDSLKSETKFITKLPDPSSSSSILGGLDANNAGPMSPGASSLYNNATNLLPQMLLSSTIPTDPASLPAGKKPEPQRMNSVTLISNKDPLSIPTTTSNFKRFVTVIGPVFWLQDRVEEIVLWKRGDRVTITWMGLYTLLCIYPRLLFVLPLVALIGFMLSTNPVVQNRRISSSSSEPSSSELDSAHANPSSPKMETKEKEPITFGDYQRNVQAIQNLMGSVADVSDYCAPYYPLVTYSPSPSSPSSTLFLLSLLSLVMTTMLVTHSIFPARFAALFGGLCPWIVLHPSIQMHATKANLIHLAQDVLLYLKASSNPDVPYIIRKPASFLQRVLHPAQDLPNTLEAFISQCIVIMIRFLDDDHLDDKCWVSQLREVELFENERLSPNDPDLKANSGWSKTHLHTVERGPWTRGRDGWSSIGDSQGHVSNLTFSLSPGWAFVETEDWRKDLRGNWISGAVDSDGWCYTNDTWGNASCRPGIGSVTRRRRWVRRIWFDPDKVDD